MGDQSYVQSNSNQETEPSEFLKVQDKDIWVDISVETSKTRDMRYAIHPDKMDEFTAWLVAIKESFMNEVF